MKALSEMEQTLAALRKGEAQLASCMKETEKASTANASATEEVSELRAELAQAAVSSEQKHSKEVEAESEAVKACGKAMLSAQTEEEALAMARKELAELL